MLIIELGKVRLWKSRHTVWFAAHGYCCHVSFLKYILTDFREEGRETSVMRDSLIGCLLHAPSWGSRWQLGHVP